MASPSRAPRRRSRSRRRATRRAVPIPLPLAGYRVVEMAHHLSAPLAGMHLADFGADVVKVEGPDGEDWRRWGRPSRCGDSQLFLATNRNKRSLALDLDRPEGRVVLDRLLGAADVLLTNYAPAVLRELGLDARSLRRRHPALIACTLSGFGARGPAADRRAFDLIVSGETGLLLLPEGAPAPIVNAAPIADTAGALMLAYGVALALLHRERTGHAQAAEATLAGAAVALQAHRFIWMDGDAAPDLRPPRTILYRAYATADGFLTVAVIAERLWRRLCRALGLESLLADSRYTPWTRLNERQEELRETLEGRFRMRTTDEWLKILVDAGVPAGRVLWGAAVFEHPALAASGVVRRGRDPRAGAYRGMGFPLRLCGTPPRVRRHAPAVGADSRAVLRELGVPRAEVTRLVRAGAVRAT